MPVAPEAGSTSPRPGPGPVAPGGEVGPRWSTREAQPTDDAFLDALYVETRLDEVLAWGFPPDLARSFLQSQAQVQRRAYALQFPGASTTILLQAERPVGRLIVAWQVPDLRVVDVSIVAAARGRGLGTWILSRLFARATALQAGVRLRAAANGRARALYQRLGFHDAAPVEQDGSVTMEWRPA